MVRSCNFSWMCSRRQTPACQGSSHHGRKLRGRQGVEQGKHHSGVRESPTKGKDVLLRRPQKQSTPSKNPKRRKGGGEKETGWRCQLFPVARHFITASSPNFAKQANKPMPAASPSFTPNWQTLECAFDGTPQETAVSSFTQPGDSSSNLEPAPHAAWNVTKEGRSTRLEHA